MSQDLDLTTDEVVALLKSRRNWGRWGDDESGTVNLITQERRVAAAQAVRRGVSLSLARPLPTTPAPNNANPVIHYTHVEEQPVLLGAGGGGWFASDFIGVAPHGMATTHLDALCHVWDEDGVFGGKDPSDVMTFDGATWGGIDVWRDGIVTRGVLVDVAATRAEGHVTQKDPVTGDELAQIVADEGIAIEPGDAIVVNCGREDWEPNPERPIYGSDGTRPGLHASCLRPLRDWDCSVLVWDMLDFKPTGFDTPWSVHGAINAYGLALVDNAKLDVLAATCRDYETHEFMLTIAPLWLAGGTSSPVNPIAIL